ncbi:hypothetical protein E3P92_01786 [Wallemia ichthyophaga]|uniref:Uncharacterized protein n=1 Tax=Wallemia ichthyophaga (strain EXF-994 / CBS 113033) TaxID=1299270 RepID=R9AG35_WALI9|nr:uncharacterized protein J056_004453 [Wallemia ichthyophaga EXF-994]EOR01132.1 hypothetical protein J056_004453 [Wallemia ichthyophaga EXF-994]TIB15146.1 hypothetical protein E3P92_01786 [Wallemia ichthyophaga]TIB35793.1 hypothetical protein E3P84_01220 [Wallemia ichthyophaga]TIB42421.1 hypothetical protein E3P83_01256 [Wallemia ichthyophaga]
MIYDQLSQRDPLPALNLDQEVYYPPLTGDIDKLAASFHVKASLHMLNDDIKSTHYYAEMNQGDSLLDYLHAIVHRREGDFWNSKWWFARVKHPLLQQVYNAKLQPAKVVDKVEEIELSNSPEAKKVLEELQYKELCLIAEYAINESMKSEVES